MEELVEAEDARKRIRPTERVDGGADGVEGATEREQRQLSVGHGGDDLDGGDDADPTESEIGAYGQPAWRIRTEHC